jgi:pimeloyl-ACP methyl ester carboxylesterase
VKTFRNGDLVFDVLDGGPRDGEPVVLLHGFPQGMQTWDEVARRLHGRGLRTLAPDQRGYSPGARPPGRRNYRLDLLVADTIALLDAAGLDRAHLVGHDWGAAVAWATAARHPDRLRSLTAVSVPHPAAFLRAVVSSPQALHSWYIVAVQLPWLPERLLAAGRARRARARWGFARTGLGPELSARYLDRLTDREALTGMLSWYRALPVTRPAVIEGPIDVPTTFIWSTGDAFVHRRGVERTARCCRGAYRLAVIEGASHWLPETEPEQVAGLIADQVAAVAPEALTRSG